MKRSLTRTLIFVLMTVLVIASVAACGADTKDKNEVKEEEVKEEVTDKEDATEKDEADSQEEEDVEDVAVSEDEKIVVGFSISTLNNPFFVDLKEAAQEIADENNVDFIVLDAGDDTTKQLADVEDLVQQEVDVIIVNPTDSDAIVSAVEAANDANIPVIAIDRSSNGGVITSYIASDNIKGGELAGEFIVEALAGTGKVIEIEGLPGTSPARDRGEGFHNIVDAEDGIEVLVSQPADFDRAQGLTLMENLLQAHPEIDAIFAHNDEMALGALEAIQASGREIIIVGFDATDDGLVAIKNGDMSATIAEQSKLMGRTGMEVAIKIAKGETVDEEVQLDVALVTLDNVDDY